MSIKQKNIFLVLGFVVILVFGYWLSISETIALKRNYMQLKMQELLFENIPGRIHKLNQKEVQYDSLLIKYKLTESSLQNNLLKTIQQYALDNSLSDIEVNPPHKIFLKTKTVNSYSFTVRGDFKSLLGLLYELEQRSKFGSVASLTFEKTTDFKTGMTYLKGNYMLQIIE